MMRNIFIYLVIFSFSISGYSQNISNVRARQEEKQIVITYDLSGGDAGQAYIVKLFVSEDGGYTWKGPLQAVTGDIGSGINAGYSKQMIWNVLSEPGRERLQGDRIAFKVRAEYTPKPITSQGGPGVTTDVEPEMVFVQGGTFQMGSNDGDPDEKPVHTVTISSFYIGKYEVTQKQWREIMGSDPPELYFKGCDQCPVERVSWNDIQEFLRKLNAKTGKNYRLPTEAEWEYAARGGNQGRGYKYSGSNSIDDVAWYDGNSKGKTNPVGKKQPNELGIYDMSGNVWEWCSDWYDENYYKNSPSYDPKGASSDTFRSLRGGSWGLSNSYGRSAFRDWVIPAIRSSDGGFRLCRTY